MRYETTYQDIDFIVRKANMPNSTKNFFFFRDETEEIGEVPGDISTEQAIEICEMMYKMWEFGRDYEVNSIPTYTIK